MRLSNKRTEVKLPRLTIVSMLAMSSFSLGCEPTKGLPTRKSSAHTELNLPKPKLDSNISLEETLLKRRSVRSYTGEPLTLHEVSQLLWAAQGTTDTTGLRTAPSAGATYPLETYLVVGKVENITPAVYRYDPSNHKLVKVLDGDLRTKLAAAALGQSCVKDGAINIIFTAIYERTTQRYGDRGIRYVHMEVGHAAQNIYLQAVTLNLATVVVGAFRDDQVREVLSLPQQEHPLYIIPVGRK